MDEGKETGRLEAFSDGVFAIAITLLVLDIKVPKRGDLPHAGTGSVLTGPLAHALVRQWPTYLAFVISFLTILIMWINHHRLFSNIRRTDQWFLLLNGLLLMGVTLVPFPTALLAEHIQTPNAPTAAAVFAASYVFIALVFNLVWNYASHHHRLLSERSDPEFVAAISRQYRFGPLLYLAAFGLAFVSVAASVGLNMLLAVFFALPGAKPIAKRK